MVNVGIIGLGPNWDNRYRPALDSLRSRIRVSAVYDPVASKAEQTALELGAKAYFGLTSLAKSSVRAVLLLDSSWHGSAALHLLCTAGKAIYVVGALGDDIASVKRLHQWSSEDGLTVMPELSCRYAPTTHRLKELMATRIGPPKRIAVECYSPDFGGPIEEHPNRELIGQLDWCRYVAGSVPVSISSRSRQRAHESAEPAQSIDIEFAQRQVGEVNPVAQLRMHAAGGPVATSQSRPIAGSFRREIECERGTATVTSPVDMTWTCEGRSSTERLTSERPDVEVMLDHFARRVVGGLIPVADLGDVCGCIALIRAAEESRQTGRPVLLNGHG